jgi:hypothetical protein
MTPLLFRNLSGTKNAVCSGPAQLWTRTFGNSTAVPTRKSVVVETVGFVTRAGWPVGTMFAFFFSFACSLIDCLRTRAALHAEILVLRHQLLVLQRSNRDRKPFLPSTAVWYPCRPITRTVASREMSRLVGLENMLGDLH